MKNKEPCSICGELRWVTTRDPEGKPICKTCHVENCSICGKLRQVATRDIDGKSICSNCNQKTHSEFCSICGKLRRVQMRSSEGAICKNCSIYLDPLKIFKKYKGDAKGRKLIFTLSNDQFFALISSNCYYCGQTRKKFNGIDRIDNNLGYIEGNCVSCCHTCNTMKYTINKDEFIRQCHLISTHCSINQPQAPAGV